MRDVAELLVPWLVAVLVGQLIVRRDERRLRGLASARAWPPSSRDAAIVGFGPIAVLVHFVRTRRTVRGVIVGLLWLAAIEAAVAVAMLPLELAGTDDDATPAPAAPPRPRPPSERR